MLFIVSTPIGNLGDITIRALETLKTCDYILCEDTRHSVILLKHYHIHKPLKSYHQFNASSQHAEILYDLEAQQNICLISDAGTPGISDPGAALIKLCIDRQLPITVIPGPCAVIQALVCSGLPTDIFQFRGFLPRKDSELKRELQEIFSYRGTTICYESPLRLLKVLECIAASTQAARELVVARELTKKFEEIVRGNAAHLITYWNEHVLKGEIVLLVTPAPNEVNEDWSQWTPEEHVNWMQQSYALTRKEAIKIVADLRGVPKRHIYQEINVRNKNS